MPDRILRAGLFTSEAWLRLKNNDDRVCFVALLPGADNLGNQPAGCYRLMHIWRLYGIDSPEKVAKVLLELGDVDLIRRYEVEHKPFVHIPRFGQSTRYPGRLNPLHPWATGEEKQVFAKKTPVNRMSPHVNHRESHDGVGVGVGVGVGEKLTSALRKPMTVNAERLLIKTLYRLRGAGNDPREVVERSIASGWAGFFALKGSTNGNARHDKDAQRRATLDALTGGYRLDDRVEKDVTPNED
jgi:hypothetical protein